MHKEVNKRTVIALDFDNTITKIPLLFKQLIMLWRHEVDFHIVTYRSYVYDDLLREFEGFTGNKVVFTDGKAKKDCFRADIWIDDEPLSITHNWKSYGYKISDKILESGDIIISKCRLDYENELTRCGGVIHPESKLLEFKFCPHCGGKLV